MKKVRKLIKKKKKELDILAYVIIIVSKIMAIIQLSVIIVNNSAQDISLAAYLGWTATAIFWTIYGLYRRVYPIMISAILSAIINAAVAYMIITLG